MNQQQGQNGFTLVELMIVIVIVAILTTVTVPMMVGRVERAKLSEGMAACSAIAASLTTYSAENSDAALDFTSLDLTSDLGFASADLDGKYFAQGDYVITAGTYDPDTGILTYTITGTPSRSNGPSRSLVFTKTADGVSSFSYAE